jgi:hypothetical protein
VLLILGDDGTQNMVPVNQPIQVGDQVMTYDLTVGKYDVAVDVGPSFTTRREEAVESMTSFIQAYPPAAPVMADMIAKASDWPDSAKLAKRMEAMLPPAIRAADAGQPAPPPEPPPEVQAEIAKAQASMQIAQQKAQQDFMLEQQKAENRAKIEQQQAMADIEVERQKAMAQMGIERQKAELQAELARQNAQLQIDLDILSMKHKLASTPVKPPRKAP